MSIIITEYKMRCFISIDLPNKIVGEIQKIQNELPEFIGDSETSSGLSRRTSARIKKTEPENLHLTLKFFGEISEEKIEQVQKILKQIKFKKFESEIDSIGFFSEDYVRIIWVHLTNCEELQKEIDEVLNRIGFKSEHRFMSHLTIARVKNLKNKKQFLEKLNKIKISKIKIIIDEFKLKSSSLTSGGPVYEDLGIYKLDN